MDDTRIGCSTSGDEQACCSFFGFTLAEDGETLLLTMTGPPEAAPLIDLLYQLAAPAGPAAPAAGSG